MKRLGQFGNFIARFWPLLVVWLLIAAIPLSRATAQRHLVGSRYEARYEVTFGGLWRELLGDWDGENANPLPAASTHPRDLDLALWETLWNSDGWYIYGRFGNSKPDLQGLIKRHPTEILAYAPALQQDLQIHGWRDDAGGTPTNAATSKSRDIARRAHRLEPDNAAWSVAEAMTAWRLNDQAAALALLQRAARSPYYDDKSLDIARRVLSAHERYGALNEVERRVIFKAARATNGGGDLAVQEAWINRMKWLAKSGRRAEALQWSATISAVGALMQRDPNALDTVEQGNQWQRQAWVLGRPKGSKLKSYESFARYVTSLGRPDLAQIAREQGKESDSVGELLMNARDADAWSNWNEEAWFVAGGLAGRIALLKLTGFGLLGAALYLFFWWSAANLFGWRAQGALRAPSSRAARLGLALGVTLPLALLALRSALWLEANDQSSRVSGPAHEALVNVFGSVLVFSYAGAPFVLALLCASITMKRHREQFALPPRVDMELALPNWARALLRWFLPLAAAGSIAILLSGWALWIGATWGDWGTVDLFKLLPPDRNGKTGSLLWNMDNEPFLLVYGMFLCLLTLVLWFAKWRWGTPRYLLPVTHGALRWWKESLGLSIVTLFWLYLLVALGSWPLNNQAAGRLERVLKNGELSVVRELSGRAKP